MQSAILDITLKMYFTTCIIANYHLKFYKQHNKVTEYGQHEDHNNYRSDCMLLYKTNVNL